LRYKRSRGRRGVGIGAEDLLPRLDRLLGIVLLFGELGDLDAETAPGAALAIAARAR